MGVIREIMKIKKMKTNKVNLNKIIEEELDILLQEENFLSRFFSRLFRNKGKSDQFGMENLADEDGKIFPVYRDHLKTLGRIYRNELGDKGVEDFGKFLSGLPGSIPGNDKKVIFNMNADDTNNGQYQGEKRAQIRNLSELGFAADLAKNKNNIKQLYDLSKGVSHSFRQGYKTDDEKRAEMADTRARLDPGTKDVKAPGKPPIKTPWYKGGGGDGRMEEQKKVKLTKETLRKIIKEELEQIGTDFPVPLSKISVVTAKSAVSSGTQDGSETDDKATGSITALPVGQLNPMQKEVIAAKALAFALGYLRDKEPPEPQLDDMEAIVAIDNNKYYIMDGHHRWAARTLIDPTAEVKVTLVKGPSATEIVTALNMWSKSKNRTGNPGKGDVTQFAASIPPLIDLAIQKGTKEGLGQWPHLTPEEVEKSLGKVPGANGDPLKGKEIMIANSKKLSTQKHPKAPLRVDMPVVKDQSEINQVVSDLVAGKIDFREPLSNKTKAAAKYVSDRGEKFLGRTGDVGKSASDVNLKEKKVK
jgi:hypothetical protein